MYVYINSDEIICIVSLIIQIKIQIGFSCCRTLFSCEYYRKTMPQFIQTQSQIVKSAKISLLSAIGNWIGDIILYPLDTISTRLKANHLISHDIIPFVRNTIKDDGILLYRGITKVSFPAAFIPTFIYVFVYDNLMNRASNFVDKYGYNPSYKLVFPFFCSSLAQVCCLIPYLPVDTVRTRIQINSPQYHYLSLKQGVTAIAQKQGIARLFKSSKIYFICKTLYTAIQFQSFEMINYFFQKSTFNIVMNTLVSTAVATTILNPLQVVITRYALVDTTKNPLNFKFIVRGIYKNEGRSGFYKGFATQILYHCAYALCWMPLYQILRQKSGIQIAQ